MDNVASAMAIPIFFYCSLVKSMIAYSQVHALGTRCCECVWVAIFKQPNGVPVKLYVRIYTSTLKIVWNSGVKNWTRILRLLSYRQQNKRIFTMKCNWTWILLQIFSIHPENGTGKKQVLLMICKNVSILYSEWAKKKFKNIPISI